MENISYWSVLTMLLYWVKYKYHKENTEALL